jgi:precorrin-6A/cobalt-precorrin-6A reductase
MPARPETTRPETARPEILRRLLILGGTAEAAALARAALARFGDRLSVISSLAGRTGNPSHPPGAVRIGGFGGVDGLAAYLSEQSIDLLIDATHPFAATIAAHGRAAAEAAGTPRLKLLRPAWRRHPLDRWVEVEDLFGAAAIVGRTGKRAWLTIGTGDLQVFRGIDDVWFLVRLIDPPMAPLPLKNYDVIQGKGPFTLEEERLMIERHRIEVIVAKASGGTATEAKIIAARAAGLPVVMVRRPPVPPGEVVDSVETALDWLGARLGPMARHSEATS